MKLTKFFLSGLVVLFILTVTLCCKLPGSKQSDEKAVLKIIPAGSSGIVLVNEAAGFSFEVPAGQTIPPGAELSVTMESDLKEKKHEQFPIDAKANEVFKKTISLPSTQPGYWQVHASIISKKEIIASAESGLAIVPQPENFGKTDTASFFGMVNVADFEAAAKMGVKFNRTPVIWSFVEHEEGQFNWTYLDNKIEDGRKNGVATVLTIVSKTLATTEKVPWAKWKDENDLVSGANLEYYKDFVKAVVSRYKDKVAAFELTNEPDIAIYKNAQAANPGFGEKAGAFATWKLHTEAYKIIKELAPETPVVGMDVSGGDFRNGMPFYKAVMSNGTHDVMDVFGGHAYTNNRAIGSETPIDFPNDYDLRGSIEKALDVTSSFGLKKRFWGTELGWMYKDGTEALSEDGREFGAVTAQALVTVKSIPGAEKLMWFVFTYNNNVGPGDLYNYSVVNGKTGNPYPYLAVNSYSAAAKLLYNTRPAGVLKLKKNVTAYVFDAIGDKHSVVVLWSNSGRTFRLNIQPDSSVHVFDMFGREKEKGAAVSITREPIYCVVSSDGESSVARDLQATGIQ